MIIYYTYPSQRIHASCSLEGGFVQKHHVYNQSKEIL